MKLSVQANNLELLKEALGSTCHSVRFGSEFCEQLLPSREELEEAYEMARLADRAFTLVTPRLSNAGIEKCRELLPLLDRMQEVGVVVNDFGALRLMERHPELYLRLGRHLITVPARSPWVDTHMRGAEESLSGQGEWLRDLYASTSMSYEGTTALYRQLGCQGVDLDWIPRIFPALSSLVQHGFRLAIHLYLVPVTFTRKCHTARFLGEESDRSCSKPCLEKALTLENEVLTEAGQRFLLWGNAVFRHVEPSSKDVAMLEQIGVSEVVLTMNPLTGIDRADGIDDVMSRLGLN
jgi:hypothetical protein